MANYQDKTDWPHAKLLDELCGQAELATLKSAARALLDNLPMCVACNSFAIGQCERGTKSHTGWVYRIEWACSKHMGVELPNGPEGEWADAANALEKVLDK